MPPEVTPTQTPAVVATEPIPPTPPSNLVFDDGVPLESPCHRVEPQSLQGWQLQTGQRHGQAVKIFPSISIDQFALSST